MKHPRDYTTELILGAYCPLLAPPTRVGADCASRALVAARARSMPQHLLTPGSGGSLSQEMAASLTRLRELRGRLTSASVCGDFAFSLPEVGSWPWSSFAAGTSRTSPSECSTAGGDLPMATVRTTRSRLPRRPRRRARRAAALGGAPAAADVWCPSASRSSCWRAWMSEIRASRTAAGSDAQSACPSAAASAAVPIEEVPPPTDVPLPRISTQRRTHTSARS